MKAKARSVVAVPADLVRPKSRGIVLITTPEPSDTEEHADALNGMAQPNGIKRESTPVDTTVVPPGRVISTTMMRQATLEQTPPPDTAQWSSAIGHASTGKSGRVIERLQQEIDRLNRDKQLLKLRHEEAERATETLHTQYRYLQDRNSNYESSHEANLRQLQRKERQVEDLREELQKERKKTARAEEAQRTAAVSEDEWREQASLARAIAQQKETEYDAIAACRNMDNDRHQNGLDRARASLQELLKKREDDIEKQKRMEIIAEQRKKEIEQLEELTKRLQTNFNSYRTEIDTAIEGLRSAASENDKAVHQRLDEMRRTTGEMRWVMQVETVINGRQVPPRPAASLDSHSDDQSFNPAQSEKATISSEAPSAPPSAPPSPSKKMSLDWRHRRRGSTKSGK